jgi:hypothetical protein
MRKLTFLALLAVLLVAAACGDTATDTTAAPATTTAPAATAAPTTTPPTTAPPVTEAAPGIVPGADADVDAVVNAYQIAFDSVSPFDVKSPYIDDPAGLESTVDAYLETGDSFGGIEVIVTGVTINGDEADVAYDLMFGGNPGYPDLEGTAVKTAAGWQVPRAVFCGLMASARTPCS